jgi:hypothetical protein
MKHSIVLDALGKARIYERLNSLNQGFEQVVRGLAELEQARLLAPEFGGACQARAQELRAEINRKLTEALSQREAADAKHFEQQRLAAGASHAGERKTAPGRKS